jgi:hypothetical protein
MGEVHDYFTHREPVAKGESVGKLLSVAAIVFVGACAIAVRAGERRMEGVGRGEVSRGAEGEEVARGRLRRVFP